MQEGIVREASHISHGVGGGWKSRPYEEEKYMTTLNVLPRKWCQSINDAQKKKRKVSLSRIGYMNWLWGKPINRWSRLVIGLYQRKISIYCVFTPTVTDFYWELFLYNTWTYIQQIQNMAGNLHLKLHVYCSVEDLLVQKMLLEPEDQCEISHWWAQLMEID